ncbi:MAG: hypothetical protein WAT39_10740 [Planctomycetota bacterium]
MHSPRRLVSLGLLVAALCPVARVAAQCATQWLPGEGVPGTSGAIQATTMWDPDGPGPAQPLLVLGGSFLLAGSTPANNIAAYDPASGTWSALGSGTSGIAGNVMALATLPNGDLVAGGAFTSAGGAAANCIARWNGTTWSALGSGMQYQYSGSTQAWVTALQILPNGDLVAAGRFTAAGGVPANCVARWDGSAWSALGSGMGPAYAYPTVNALAALPNGELVAGGVFTTAGGAAANNIARWNGATWSAVGTGLNDTVQCLTTLSNGDVVAGGLFTTAGGTTANHIARWNGTAWSALGTGVDGQVSAVATRPNGDIVAGGYFTTAGGVAAIRIARWDGTTWSALGSGTNEGVRSLANLPNGDLVAGGYFDAAGGVVAKYVARWDGAAWSALATGTNSLVRALAVLPNGDLVAGGFFTTIGGVSANHIARWNGATWSALGSGTNLAVTALLALPNGDVVAGGFFTTAGGVVANDIARWDGAAWSPLGTGLSGGAPFLDGVRALLRLPNGDLVAAGGFTNAGGVAVNGIARWDGTTWSPLGPGLGYTGGGPGLGAALARLANGDVVVAGGFELAGGVLARNIARWNGTTWSAMGGSMNGQIEALTTLPNGDLIVGGGFTYLGSVNASRIIRWNGATWSALGAGVDDYVFAFATLPNGDLLAGGHFKLAGGVSARRVARWDGTSWSALGSGIGASTGSEWVYAAALLPDGDVVWGGNFFLAGGAASAYVARLTTTCPATAVPHGAGCAGSGGLNVLTATLPWTGSTYRATTTGLPPVVIAMDMIGTAAVSIPLPTLLPQGVPGCSLLVSPGAIGVHVPTTGSLETTIAIPNTSVLAGLIVYQQVAALEPDPVKGFVVTSTNALTLTIGVF